MLKELQVVISHCPTLSFLNTNSHTTQEEMQEVILFSQQGGTAVGHSLPILDSLVLFFQVYHL